VFKRQRDVNAEHGEGRIMSLKVSTWNLEHADRLVSNNLTAQIMDRRQRVLRTFQEIDPDIICLVEGPKGENGITEFCQHTLENHWLPIMLKGPNDPIGVQDNNYQLKGSQWMWFLAKPHLANHCRLQEPNVWQAFIGSRTWKVNYWGQIRPTVHSHYRHPQVMILDVGNGEELELIGLHMKSKINQKRITRDENGNLTGDYLEEALKARVKLATEAKNVRDYVRAKFNQVARPGIMILGDCNDGPGQDFFEGQYLHFDLIQNIQGEVLVSERFFNHALFDFPEHLRWTARFRDPILEIPESQNPLLLDHILISQPLVNGSLSVQVNSGAGSVEHEAYQRANAGSNSQTRTSDHRPVSCRIDN
jgi:hypothetical protein